MYEVPCMLAMESRERVLLGLPGRDTGKDVEALEKAVFVETPGKASIKGRSWDSEGPAKELLSED